MSEPKHTHYIIFDEDGDYLLFDVEHPDSDEKCKHCNDEHPKGNSWCPLFVSGIVEAWVGDRKDRLYRYCTLHQRMAAQDDVMCSASACAHCCRWTQLMEVTDAM